VLSLSLGGGKDAAVEKAVKEASASGLIVVLAAGNDNENACDSSPAAAGLNSDVITVGAIDRGDRKASYSNFGKCLDIFAPGTNIESCWSGSPTAVNILSGTSMAAPHVAGAAALFLQNRNGVKSKALSDLMVNFAVKNTVSEAGKNSPNRLLQIPKHVGAPTTYSPTAPTKSPTTAPGVCVAGDCFPFREAEFGPPFPTSSQISGKLIVAKTIMCSSTNEDFDGNVVLIDRGTCDFVDKATRAQNQGASFVILGNTQFELPFVPGMPDGYIDDILNIPTVSVSYEDATSLKQLAGETAVVGMQGSLSPTTPSPTSSPILRPCITIQKSNSCNSAGDRCVWLNRYGCVDSTSKTIVTAGPGCPTTTYWNSFKMCTSLGKRLCNEYEVFTSEYAGDCKYSQVWTSTIRCGSKRVASRTKTRISKCQKNHFKKGAYCC